MAMAGKKKGNGVNGGASGDTTGTLPETSGTEPGPTAEEAELEAIAINTVLDAVDVTQIPMIAGPLGQQAADEGVLGLDADTFAYPTPDEWLTGWLTRWAYWNTYPMYHAGWPFQLPLSCILVETCDPALLPARSALVRIHEGILAGFAERGYADMRFDAATGTFA
jgi:hypothetical protein